MPPRPAPPGFTQIRVRLWLALPRFGGEEERVEIPLSLHKHGVSYGLPSVPPWQGLGSEAKAGVLLSEEVLRLSRGHREHLKTRIFPASLPLSTAYRRSLERPTSYQEDEKPSCTLPFSPGSRTGTNIYTGEGRATVTSF